MAQTVPATFVAEGVMIDYTPGSAVTAGSVVVQNGLLGIATHPIDANAKGALRVAGVFDFPKKTNEAISIGTVVYWDSTNGWVTATSSYAPPVAGITVKAALAADTTCRVRLIPGLLHDT